MIITYDLGTTRLKVAAFSLEGKVLAQLNARNTEFSEARDKWQSADEWWENTRRLTQELLSLPALKKAKIMACSLSGRGGAAVFIDKNDQVLMQPWSDNRHSRKLRQIGQDSLSTKAGLSGYGTLPIYGTTLLSKYLWLREEKPDLATKTRHVLYAKDFILYRLTGQAKTDPSSGPDQLSWDQYRLSDLDIDPDLLPKPIYPWELAGVISKQAEKQTGIAAGTPVATGAHDGICAQVGAAAIEPGQYAITLGTHAVVRAISDNVPKNAIRFYGLPPDKHVLGGNALMSGRSADWFLDNWTNTDESQRSQTFDELNHAAAVVPPGANGVFFLPFLAGQIAPVQRRTARAAFYGLSINTTREDMYRALLEGASFAITNIFTQVQSEAGEPDFIGLTGSGAQSHVWAQVITNLIQKPLHLTDGSAEGRGAAIFAAMALKSYASLKEAVEAMVDTSKVCEPRTDQLTTYSRLMETWLALCESTRPFD